MATDTWAAAGGAYRMCEAIAKILGTEPLSPEETLQNVRKLKIFRDLACGEPEAMDRYMADFMASVSRNDQEAAG